MTVTSLVAAQSNIHPGPNLPGQVSALFVMFGATMWMPWQWMQRTMSQMMTTMMSPDGLLGPAPIGQFESIPTKSK